MGCGQSCLMWIRTCQRLNWECFQAVCDCWHLLRNKAWGLSQAVVSSDFCDDSSLLFDAAAINLHRTLRAVSRIRLVAQVGACNRRSAVSFIVVTATYMLLIPIGSFGRACFAASSLSMFWILAAHSIAVFLTCIYPIEFESRIKLGIFNCEPPFVIENETFIIHRRS